MNATAHQLPTPGPTLSPLQAALEYARLGWPVLPLHHVIKTGSKDGPDRATCSCQKADCSSQGKHPRTETGLREATTSLPTIQSWWRRWPDAGVALATGTVFDVIDVDAPEAGPALLAAGLDLAALTGPKVSTGNGTHHYIAPNDRRNRVAVVPGCDLRGAGGYVVAPPSVHYSGSVYTWADGRGPSAVLEHVDGLETIGATRPTPTTTGGQPCAYRPPATLPDGMTPYATAKVNGALTDLAAAPEGGRNNQLNASAYSLGRVVASGEMWQTEAERLLLDTAMSIGLEESEALRTIASGIEKGRGEGPTAPHQDALNQAARLPARHSHPGALGIVSDAGMGGDPSGPDECDTVAPGPAPTPLNLPPEFWESRPVLIKIRDAAWSRVRSPDAVLGALLARLASAVPPAFRIPAIVGSPASTNLYVALAGPSGTGKSTSIGLAAELLQLPGLDAKVRSDARLGSGEGLIEAYMGKQDGRKQQAWVGAHFTLDEGAALAALGDRRGSTTLATLREMWTGAGVGQSNASEETTRSLKAGSYSLGFVMGIQPKLANCLFSGEAAGTPQRFIWSSTTDPAIPEGGPEWPGPITWTAPQLEGVDKESALQVHEDIRGEIKATQLAVNRGVKTQGDLDSHRDLSRLKVAALFALLDRRRNVDLEDWALAGMVLDTSDAVRADAMSAVRWESEEKDRKKDRDAGRHAKIAAEAMGNHEAETFSKALEAAARAAWSKANRAGRVSRKDIREAISGRDKKAIGGAEGVTEAIRLAVERGWLVATEDDGCYDLGPAAPPT